LPRPPHLLDRNITWTPQNGLYGDNAWDEQNATGNESESYAVIARLPGLTVLRSQSLSLMAQDRTLQPRLIDRFRDAGIELGDTVGLVGWKYLEPEEPPDGP
jgi:hypothetical protein